VRGEELPRHDQFVRRVLALKPVPAVRGTEVDYFAVHLLLDSGYGRNEGPADRILLQFPACGDARGFAGAVLSRRPGRKEIAQKVSDHQKYQEGEKETGDEK